MYYENFEKLCQINSVKPGHVSKATGISTATLTSWKKGAYTPKQDKLQLIADYFHVSVDYIMHGTEVLVEVNTDDYLEIAMNKRLMEYAKKLLELSEENRENIYNNIDFLKEKEGRR